jgi:hypothetical protein
MAMLSLCIRAVLHSDSSKVFLDHDSTMRIYYIAFVNNCHFVLYKFDINERITPLLLLQTTVAVTAAITKNNNKNNSFKIAGSTPGMKLSWHVTEITKDP